MKAETAMAFDGKFDPDLPWRDARNLGFNATTGPFFFASLGGGLGRFYLDTDERHRNFGGVCHGGVYMTLLDYAMGLSASEAAEGRRCATISMETQFLSAARLGERVHGESRVVRLTRDICFLEAEAWSADRKVVRSTSIYKYVANQKGAAAP